VGALHEKGGKRHQLPAHHSSRPSPIIGASRRIAAVINLPEQMWDTVLYRIV
jgi:hypothetical protein